MSNYLNKFHYQNVPYVELTNPSERQEIESLALKLISLENEITSADNGRINIKKSGTIFVDSFDKDLSDRILVLIA